MIERAIRIMNWEGGMAQNFRVVAVRGLFPPI
jgi:hypothetical protein